MKERPSLIEAHFAIADISMGYKDFRKAAGELLRGDSSRSEEQRCIRKSRCGPSKEMASSKRRRRPTRKLSRMAVLLRRTSILVCSTFGS